jgi:2-polyprenyl-3-methyl-5-hydroxy-6-metoxy-1,4-benzoquinol methylase
MNFFGYEREPAGRKRIQVLTAALSDFSAADRFRVVDIGCGLGSATKASALQYQNGIFFGVDYHEGTIREACKDAPPNIHFFVGSADATLGRFDAVLIQEVLEHTPDPQKVAEALRDLLAPRGILFVTVPNGFSPKELLSKIFRDPRTGNLTPRLLKLRAKLIRSKSQQTLNTKGFGHIQYFSIRAITRVLAASGFRVRERHKSNFGWGFGFLWFYFFRLFLTSQSKFFRTLDTLDCALADRMPYWMAGGWYLICEKQDRKNVP